MCVKESEEFCDLVFMSCGVLSSLAFVTMTCGVHHCLLMFAVGGVKALECEGVLSSGFCQVAFGGRAGWPPEPV